jgi:hypothetical protein
VDRFRQVAKPPRLFRASERDPAAEVMLSPIVSRVLAQRAGALRHQQIECRGPVCKVTLLAAESADAEGWKWLFDESADILAQGRVSMEPPFPTNDPVTKEGLNEWHIYLTMHDAAGAPSGEPGERRK